MRGPGNLLDKVHARELAAAILGSPGIGSAGQLPSCSTVGSNKEYVYAYVFFFCNIDVWMIFIVGFQGWTTEIGRLSLVPLFLRLQLRMVVFQPASTVIGVTVRVSQRMVRTWNLASL